MMKNKLLPLILISLFATPALAEKPDFSGKGKPAEEQLKTHKATMEAKEDMDDDDGEMKREKIKQEKKEKIKEQDREQMQEMKEGSGQKKAMEKQSIKKSEQNRNELGKGSEQGQESRETNSKKWWKFWGE